MKLTKRILATLVAVVFVMTSFVTVPAFAAFTDLTAEDNSYDAVNVLNKLGVINGYDDGSFKPENNVTRAEFTAMLLRTRGMGSVGSTSLENPPFPDVVTSDVSWAIGNIRTAREMGIINGYDDGTFKPNNNVSYEEAIKMIVCALGYGEMGNEGAMWYSKYLATAQSLGFLEGSGGAIATPATRATIAKMLYNCLEVNLAENNAITNKTILENDLRLTKNVGYISATPALSLDKPDAKLRDNEIAMTTTNSAGIETTTTFQVDDVTKYADMLGAQVTYYYTEDRGAGKNTLLMADVKNSEILEIDAVMIRDFSDTEIKYLKNEDSERTSTAGIDANSIVVYNGKLFGSNRLDSSFTSYKNRMSNEGLSVMPTVGSVKLLDREGDGKYDVLFINSYKVWVVSSTTSSNYTVVDNVLRKDLLNDNKLVLDPYASNVEIKFITADGANSSFSAIRKGTVVCYMESKNTEGIILKTAVICNNSVNGTITTTSIKNGVTINGKTYKYSKQAPWEGAAVPGGSTLAEPTRGDGGTFYLDINGNIIAYDKTESKVSQEYGYLKNTGTEGDSFEEKVVAIISTKSNVNGAKYYVTEKSKIIGGAADKTDKEILEAAKGKIVKFSVNGSNINELIIAEDAAVGKEIVPDALYKYTGLNPIREGKFKYDKNLKEFTGKKTNGEDGKLYIGSASFIINVKDANKPKIMGLGDFQNERDYEISFYDVTTSDSAKAIIVYSGDDNIGRLTANSPVILVKEKQDKGDGEYVLYDINDKEYIMSTENSEDFDTKNVAKNIKEGDVVRLRGVEGQYELKDNNDIVFTISSNPTGKDEKEKDENGNILYRGIWGSVYKKYDGERLIVYTKVLEGWDGTGEKASVSGGIEVPLQNSWFNGSTKFYQIDTTKDNEITALSENYADILDSLIHYADGENVTSIDRPTEIFIHMNSANSVKMVVIVKR